MAIKLISEERGVYTGIKGREEDPEMIFLFGYDPQSPPCRYQGKWVANKPVEEIKRLVAEHIKPAIERGDLKAASYRPKPNDPRGPWKDLHPPICIYTQDESDKERVKGLLDKLDVSGLYWQQEPGQR